MADREKVIEGLENCKDIHRAGRWAQGCAFCGYADKRQPDCFLALMDDAIALLKEQPEIVRCKDCKHWDSEERNCNIKIGWLACGADWFCADGTKGGEAK